MNDLSKNKYLKNRNTDIADYSIDDYLRGDIAVQRVVDADRVLFIMSNLLAAHRFNIHLLGFDYLSYLAAAYVLRKDYNETIVIGEIAELNNLDYEIVRQCIATCIYRNKSFVKIAKHTLGEEPRFDGAGPEISDAVEILGALFVIYYNYTVPD